MNDNMLLDVIVRFHDLRRLYELNRCIFSLICQDYRPVRVILVTQRFSPNEIEETLQCLSPTLCLNNKIELQIINFEETEPIVSVIDIQTLY